MPWTPYAARLQSELRAIADEAEKLVDASGIEFVGDRNRGGHFIIIAPDWEWTEPTDEVRRLQLATLPSFDRWYERTRLLFQGAPADLLRELEEAHDRARLWISRDGHDWELPRSVALARPLLRKHFERLDRLLGAVAPATDDVRVIAVPDTSALIDVPDLGRYPAALGDVAADIYLVAPVLAELDSLKDQGRNAEVREKARLAGRAIKGIRERGSLITGVTLADEVRVFARPQEPRFEDLPGHLDPAVPDDRVLAAAFELQRAHATAAVVLVTGDINLQTKAEAAGMPFVEPPEPAQGT